MAEAGALSSSLHSAFESLRGKWVTVIHTLLLLARRRNAKGRGAAESRGREQDSRRGPAGRTPVTGRRNRGEPPTPRALVSPALPAPCAVGAGETRGGRRVHPHAPARPSPPHPPARPDATWPGVSVTRMLIVRAPDMAAAECGFRGGSWGRRSSRPKANREGHPSCFVALQGPLPRSPRLVLFPSPQSPREAGPREQSELRTSDSHRPGFKSRPCQLLHVT